MPDFRSSWLLGRPSHALASLGSLDDRLRKLNESTNEIIAGLADGKQVHFLDINQKFLADDGTLPKSIMPDLLHPNAEGYKLWAEAMEPTVKKLLDD